MRSRNRISVIASLFGCLMVLRHQRSIDAFVFVPQNVIQRPASTSTSRRSFSSFRFEDNKIQKKKRRRQYQNHNSRKYKGKKAPTNEQRNWLRRTSKHILRQKPGSLVKGKWHELVSMLKAWSKYRKSEPEAPVMIEKLIKRLLDEQRAGNNEVETDIELYNILLDSWACAALFRTDTNPVLASQRAREILVLLQETFEESISENKSLQPDAESFDVVFHVVNKIEGPTIARRILAWMEHLYQKEKNEHAKPLKKHYIMLLDAYSNCRDGNAGQLAEGVIRHMKATGHVQPDTLCYNIAIKAWIKAKRGRESAEHAHQLLEEMEAPKDIVTYSSAIAAWGSSGMRSHAVDRAEELLQKIHNSSNVQPNTIVYNTVMSTWVKSRSPDAAKRTRAILKQMKADESSTCSPDLISYNTHIHALSLHAKRPEYANRANQLLCDLENQFEAGEISFRPNLFTYNLVIDAWTRSLDYNAAWNAVRVLRQMISSDQTPSPDAFSFNQVLSALSRSPKPGAAALAEKLLGYMEDSYRMKIHPNARPDVIGYTSVICTLSRSGEKDAAERAERIFNRMKERFEAGETYIKPNRACFNALIDCWSQSKKGTFAARKAEALLHEMEERFALGDQAASPNIISYNSVLNSWANSRARCCGHQAEKHLNRMWKLYDDGHSNIAPNEFSFNTVINAISKSQSRAKAQRALRILRRMDKLYQSGYKKARPNEVTYTSVLHSCAFPATLDPLTRRKALDTAIFTLQELQASHYGHPNEITYGIFLQACANLMPSDEDEFLRQVIQETFQQCCKDGQVGEIFLTHLKSAAPKDLYRELLAEVAATSSSNEEESTVNLKNLPPEWSCNIRQHQKRYPKRKDTSISQAIRVARDTNSKLQP